MTPTTTVQLGDFTFADFEVPERIPFGGEQKVAVHELVGGVRVVDTMGRSDRPLTWSGRFRGSSASQRARYLDGLRIAGKVLTLTWAEFSYSVVLATFEGDYERPLEVPYTLTCVVVEDQSSPPTSPSDAGVDDAMSSDMADASDYGDDIGDALLSGNLGSLQSAISAISSFATAPGRALGTVLLPLQAAQARVTTLIAGGSDVLTGDLGGFGAGADPDIAAASLATQIAASTQLPNLYALGSALGRMAMNVDAVGVSGRQVSVGGGDLYHLAAQAYGDPAGWSTIANANRLVDPVLAGVQTVRIPPQIDGSGGVLTP